MKILSDMEVALWKSSAIIFGIIVVVLIFKLPNINQQQEFSQCDVEQDTIIINDTIVVHDTIFKWKEKIIQSNDTIQEEETIFVI